MVMVRVMDNIQIKYSRRSIQSVARVEIQIETTGVMHLKTNTNLAL